MRGCDDHRRRRSRAQSLDNESAPVNRNAFGRDPYVAKASRKCAKSGVLDGDALYALRLEQTCDEIDPLREAAAHDHTIFIGDRCSRSREVCREGRPRDDWTSRVRIAKRVAARSLERSPQAGEPCAPRKRCYFRRTRHEVIAEFCSGRGIDTWAQRLRANRRDTSAGTRFRAEVALRG